MIGAEPLSAPLDWPDNLEYVRSTPVFTADTVPAGLRADHSTKDGTWGRLCVLSGKLHYEVCDPRRPASTTLLTPASPPAIIEPTILHRVEPDGAVEFKVEFWRAP
jgi:tellurite resistance-related uncharacterized protein